MLKLDDVKVGDVLIADGGFTCLKPGPHEVKADEEGRLFIACAEDRHFLEGQIDFKDPTVLIGLSK